MKTNTFASRISTRLAVAAALLAWTAGASRAASAFNTFDTGPGTWTSATLTTAPGFNLGWSGTSFASGFGGEIGGLVSRTNSPSGSAGTPRILDTISFAGGNTLTLNSPLSVSGKVYLQDLSASTDLNFGYFSASDPGNQRAVLRLISPASAGSGLWRFRFGLDGSSGTRVNALDNTWNAASLDFTFNWTPSGLNDGSGTLSGSISKGASLLTIPSQSLGANSAIFDSFGLWVDSAGSTDLSQTEYVYFDNIQYTVVPEPAPSTLFAVLGGLGLAVVGVRRRAHRPSAK